MNLRKKSTRVLLGLMGALLLAGCGSTSHSATSNVVSASSVSGKDAWQIWTPYNGTKTIYLDQGLKNISESTIYAACGFGDSDISLGLYASQDYRLQSVYHYEESQGTLKLYAMSQSQYKTSYLSIKVGTADIPVLKNEAVDFKWVLMYLGQYGLADDCMRYGLYTDDLYLHSYAGDLPTSSLQLYYASVPFYSYWTFLFVSETLQSKLKVSFPDQNDVANFTSWEDIIKSKDASWLQNKTISGVYTEPTYSSSLAFSSIVSHTPYLLYLQLA
jgi:hypothetical protein